MILFLIAGLFDNVHTVQLTYDSCTVEKFSNIFNTSSRKNSMQSICFRTSKKNGAYTPFQKDISALNDWYIKPTLVDRFPVECLADKNNVCSMNIK